MSDDFYMGVVVGVFGLAIVVLLMPPVKLKSTANKSPLKNWDVGHFVVEYVASGGYERYGTLADAIKFRLSGESSLTVNVVAHIAGHLPPDKQLALAAQLGISPYMLSPGLAGYTP